MGNMKFDGADVTFELDGYDALVERVRSKKVNCKINPSDLPRLYAVMDAELEGNEELAAAFAEAQEAAFGEAVLTVWAERIKSFKDSFIPVFGEACKDAACRFGFSKDGNNTFKSAVDAFAANICDLYGAAPQIVDGFCEFLARNACLEFDGYAADMPVPCQLYVAEGISKMAYQQAMNSVRGFKLDTDASVEFADKFINDNVTTPDSFIHLNDACIAIENVKAATSTPSVPEASVKFAVTQAAFEHKTVDHFDDALRPVYTDETDAEFEDAVDAAAWGSLCPLRGSFNTRVARFTANEGAFLHKRSIWREKHNSIDSISAVRPWDWSALGRNRSHGVSRFPRPKNEKAP